MKSIILTVAILVSSIAVSAQYNYSAPELSVPTSVNTLEQAVLNFQPSMISLRSGDSKGIPAGVLIVAGAALTIVGFSLDPTSGGGLAATYVPLIGIGLLSTGVVVAIINAQNGGWQTVD